ncbi:hypothetical protein HK096_002149, partial [Nowakowskiella sp. JEL0078]
MPVFELNPENVSKYPASATGDSIPSDFPRQSPPIASSLKRALEDTNDAKLNDSTNVDGSSNTHEMENPRKQTKFETLDTLNADSNPNATKITEYPVVADLNTNTNAPKRTPVEKSNVEILSQPQHATFSRFVENVASVDKFISPTENSTSSSLNFSNVLNTSENPLTLENFNIASIPSSDCFQPSGEVRNSSVDDVVDGKPLMDPLSINNDQPRQQRIRFPGDVYTPQWVRHSGHQKEGFCEQCPEPGRWLQLKNSAYWYHKQFYHGISSISGTHFAEPIDIRVVALTTPQMSSYMEDQTSPTIMVEGLCHFCCNWLPLMNPKKRFSSNSIVKTGFNPAHQHLKDPSENQQSAPAPFVLPPGIGSVPDVVLQEINDIINSKGMVVLWFRHAHKCHVYHKPKSSALTENSTSDATSQQNLKTNYFVRTEKYDREYQPQKMMPQLSNNEKFRGNQNVFSLQDSYPSIQQTQDSYPSIQQTQDSYPSIQQTQDSYPSIQQTPQTNSNNNLQMLQQNTVTYDVLSGMRTPNVNQYNSTPIQVPSIQLLPQSVQTRQIQPESNMQSSISPSFIQTFGPQQINTTFTNSQPMLSTAAATTTTAAYYEPTDYHEPAAYNESAAYNEPAAHNESAVNNEPADYYEPAIPYRTSTVPNELILKFPTASSSYIELCAEPSLSELTVTDVSVIALTDDITIAKVI